MVLHMVFLCFTTFKKITYSTFFQAFAFNQKLNCSDFRTMEREVQKRLFLGFWTPAGLYVQV